VAVTFVGAGTFVGGTGAVTPGMPAGIQANDILLLFVETANQAASLSTANGFAVIGSPVGTGTAAAAAATRLSVFWKRAVGGDASPVVADSGDHQAARIGAWRGVKTATPPWNGGTPTYNVDATSDTTGSPITPTTTVAGCGVVVACSNTVDSNTGLTATYSSTTIPDLAATGMADNTNAGQGGGFNIGFGTQTNAGAIGTITVTLSSASQKSMLVIPLEPAAAIPAIGVSPTSLTFQA
jgi:hypothetical protein